MVEHPTPSVVVSMQALARLEGAEFHMERVIDLRERQSRFHGLLEAEDALLLVAVGNVIAGVDLGDVVEADVEISDDFRSVKLRLPAPEIFSARLDSSRTYVHSRSTDLLAERQENLETKARQRAEETLRQAALEAGVLDKARISVERSVTALLRSLGFSRIEISFEDPVSDQAPTTER